ncbi:SpoIIE family protein phosphatase [uncultured Pseudomonas sp.]|uniref:SpoIIE family protein phosphatase n=1 Tax=uncultured Pseudomonas sp. TaxID=114707 RepID=UPI0025D45DDF|nr:SpoIIE family protein phosphatase [uncultured Pseudomonas sp.]
MALSGQPCSLVLPVSTAVHVDAARRALVRLAGSVTQDETLLGRLTIVAQELGYNLVRHAGHGELCATLGDAGVLDVLAVDRGPGMQDVARCLTDSYSTAATLGAGLGAIRRQSDVFDIHSRPGQGTVVLARFHLAGAPNSRLHLGALCTPHPEEQVCGDTWAVSGRRLLVCDGLGHGQQAAAASRRARELFLRQAAHLPLQQLMENLHQALMETRGAALALAELDADQGQVSFCGIGNIAGRLFGNGARSLVSNNGTLGYRIGRIQTFTYPWTPGTLLVMNSDGLTSKVSLGEHSGLGGRHPALIAALLHRDFRRPADDATVLVLKHV